jgi:DNA-binding CsgD family transcriptional regulator
MRLTCATDRIRQQLGVTVAFAGTVLPSTAVLLNNFAGASTGALPGVALRYNQGLGGRAIALRRPVAVDDYCASKEITHHYDLVIRREGLRSMAAAPVVIDRKPVAVLYAAFRTDEVVGDRLQSGLNDEARSLEQELLSLDAIRKPDRPCEEISRMEGRVHAAFRELRVLSRTVADPELQQRLREIAGALAAREVPPRLPTALTAREVDVLALAGAGLPNRSIASRLGLTVNTVKGYMKSAMCKLHASTRLEAVVAARRVGLLP